MRQLGTGDFADRVTCLTGPGRASGKTSLMLAAMAMLRREDEKPAILGIGFEGEAKGPAASDPHAMASRAARIGVEEGELFASASSWLPGSGTEAEILGVLSGSGAFGRLALARARRSGDVVLVGPESNEAMAEAVGLMRVEGASTILIDGAFGRLTQVAAIPGARFMSSLIIENGGLARAVASMRRLALLAGLPIFDPKGDREAIGIEGPLTAAVAETLPEKPSLVQVDDFTKVFLEEGGLKALLRKHQLVVARAIEFGGFVVALRGIAGADFEKEIGSSVPEDWLYASPYAEGKAVHAA